MTDTMEELADKLDATIKAATRTPMLVEARAACNEAGVHKARADLIGALDILNHAQEAKRTAEAQERTAKDAHTDAAVEAEWALAESCFDLRSNKTWLVKDAQGKPLDEAQQRSVTADEKRTWIAHHVGQAPEVKRTAKVLREAEANTARARDDVNLAERRFSASKAELTAAVAVLATLRMAMEAPTT